VAVPWIPLYDTFPCSHDPVSAAVGFVSQNTELSTAYQRLV
jgi:hypothetical protein